MEGCTFGIQISVEIYRQHTEVWAQMYEAYRCMGVYRCMGPCRHIGDVWGLTNVPGNTDVWGMYKCMGSTQMYGGYTDVWGVQMWGSYDTPQT